MRPIKIADLSLFEHDPEEKIIGEVPRHSIGLYFIFFNAIFLSAILIGAMLLVAKYELEAKSTVGLSDTPQVAGWLAVIIIVLIILLWIGSFLAAVVYRRNYLVLTSHKLVLINSKNIVARKISQLSIGDVQDTTVNQNSLFSRIFNYGTLNIETAGEQANFQFFFVPNPTEVAKAIVESHEENLKLYGN